MAPINSSNMEMHSQKLFEPDLPVQVRLQLVMEVRDSLEMTHTPDYLNFLRCYFRAFSAILSTYTSPQATENAEHKLRNVVIEILNRLPHNCVEFATTLGIYEGGDCGRMRWVLLQP
ncbi:hypothetical protein TRIUR3_08968 [Triticum urartu]|uniref:Uncharacterized protein n=1 Tax=Triticum urartu TaxID=4572 RepID=M7ZX70_TRIUA|nr:hypothetical protein TRIUR3_08968 [Triticum urartu]